MDTTTIGSHATSGALHALALFLAFLAPVTDVLYQPPAWHEPQRVVRAAFAEPAPEPVRVRTTEVFAETGVGDAPGNGMGDDTGPRPGTRVKSTPPQPERATAADPSARLTEELGALLAGFADETTGPDTATILGAIDDGGGGSAFGGLGFAGMGRGASCARSWEEVEGKLVVTRHEGCKGISLASVSTGGMHAARGRGATPDLGGKDGAAPPKVHVLASPPTSCGKTAEQQAAACPWKDIIERVIKRHKRELEYCFADSLKREARAVTTEIDVSFAIAPAGGTATIELAEPSGVRRLDDCVAARVANWIFPATGLDIRANYPFRFRSI